MFTIDDFSDIIMLSPVDTNIFSDYLMEELNIRGWTQADLARRSGMTRGAISHVLNGDRQPGPDFCSGIARAFGLPPAEVFRAAGLLPPAPERTNQIDELTHLVGGMSAEEIQDIIDYARMRRQKSNDRRAQQQKPSRRIKPPARSVLKDE